MTCPVVAELSGEGLGVAACCRVLGVSASGFYEWRGREPSPRQLADEQLTAAITAVHQAPRELRVTAGACRAATGPGGWSG